MAEKEPSQRQLRVGQEIKKILAGFIDHGEIRNLEGIHTMVTITEVRVSPDLKYASVYLMTTNGEHLKEVLDGLQLAANYLRKQVAGKLQLRYAPELVFKIDDTFEQVDKIERLLRDPKVQEDLNKE
ncbi:MAG: 30S ribosome-binding factor RbfA [Alphaproteobacteria bacterium]|nr:30S ribosome-binding factor RbfA [Alphaproteobacteria bacterium]